MDTSAVEAALDQVFRRTPGEYQTPEEQAQWRTEFGARAVDICSRHLAQTAENVRMLEQKYRQPFIGERPIGELLRLLGCCIDPSDTELYCASQLTHSLQMAEAMLADHMPEEMILVALVHDIGKLMLLTGEDPANVIGPNEPIGARERGTGLDRIMTTWNHDELGYQRLRPYLSHEQAWLLRYHSFRFDLADDAMSAQDRRLHERWLLPFRHYDLHTKSPFALPKVRLEDFADLLSRQFPKPIPF